MNALARRITWTVALGLCTVASCSNQGEGARCDWNNGDSDCADGLTCQRVPGRPESQYCCPPPGQSTVQQCSLVFVYDADAGTIQPAPDAGQPAPDAGQPAPDAGGTGATLDAAQPSPEAAPDTGEPDATTSTDAATDANDEDAL